MFFRADQQELHYSLLAGLTQISSADGNFWSFICLVTAPLKAPRLGHGTMVLCERFSCGAALGMTSLGKRWGKTERTSAELLFKSSAGLNYNHSPVPNVKVHGGKVFPVFPPS